MEIVPVYLRTRFQNVDERDGLVARSEQPVLPEVIKERRIQLRWLQDQTSYFVERVLSKSRVIIVEGISGSGKDMFQTYLNQKLKGRDVYDYSEGEVLHSWKQLQIEGIFELRVKFMKLFVNYVREVIGRDQNAVFVLNRFHLSTYASTIIQQPKLGRQYDQIINVLRMLPVHVFILQLDQNEIVKKSMHPERSGAWRKFQQQIAGEDGFRSRLERQQRLILNAAEKQQIPYSVIKLVAAPDIKHGWFRIPASQNIVHHSAPMNAADARISRKK